ncbi:fimbrial protein [Bordetella avium]|uniref:Fimbrial subunit n=1 Tax=Bordetella avium (strain 197N) TaxID=360910 RepID=Q2L0Z4_BORA1|nr:fimbrial protein [Bordetella avium]CAJ49384.1 fimbrial subunit [Bordetella avium 197N]
MARQFTALLALGLLVLGEPQADTLTIKGRVTTPPCTLSNVTVPFGNVPVSEFDLGGNMGTSYAKDFTMTVGGCDLAVLQSVTLSFEGQSVPQIPNAQGLALSNDANAAVGIAISVTRNDDSHTGKGQAVRFDGSESYPLNLSANKNTYLFSARYVRVPGEPLRPGTANAVATVTVSWS